jgi:hypothetical protein
MRDIDKETLTHTHTHTYTHKQVHGNTCARTGSSLADAAAQAAIAAAAAINGGSVGVSMLGPSNVGTLEAGVQGSQGVAGVCACVCV